MRKFAMFALAALVSVTLVGCGEKKDEKKIEIKANDKGIDIKAK